MLTIQFLVDEGIVKAGIGGIGGNAGVKHPRRTRPVNRAQAHRARFARRIKIAASKLKLAELAASFAYRHHFGVRGGIVRRCHAIYAFRHYPAVFYNHSGKWSALAASDVFYCQSNRAAHEFFHHLGFFSFQVALTPGKYQY